MKNHSRIAAMTILAIGLLSTSSVNADCGSDATWDIGGVVDSCNALGCDLFGISIGDPVTGFLSADVAAAGPNSTFGAADIIDYEFVAGGISFSPADSTLVSATFSTDVDGEIASGSLVLLGSVDLGPPFGLADLEVVIDAGASTFQIETDFLGLGVVASGTLDFTLSPDTDGDGQPDTCDPDDDNDGIGDAHDSRPLIPSNLCTARDGDNATLAELIVDDLTCAAKGSIDVQGATQVLAPDGHLHVIAPTIGVQSGFGVAGQLSATSADPCPGCDALPGYSDVQPFLEAKCAPCHTGLGVGGNDIGTTYLDAFLPADSANCTGLNVGECSLVQIQNGEMPQGAGCTGDPVLDAGNASCLSQAEQDLVQAWIDGGLLE